MSTVSEALANMPSKQNGGATTCRFGEMFEKFPEDKDGIVEAVSSRRFSNATLSTTLTQATGLNVGESTVRNHVTNRCKWCADHGIRY